MLDGWYQLDNVGVWPGADAIDWECADGMSFLSPWYPRCERPGDDGLAGSLLPTGLASTPWQYPAGMEWLQIEWPEADWSECLQITSGPLGFDEQQPEWHESESIPQETEIPWPERLDLTLFPNGPQEQMDWWEASWNQYLRNHIEWPGLNEWPVEPQEQETQRVEDVLSPQDDWRSTPRDSHLRIARFLRFLRIHVRSRLAMQSYKKAQSVGFCVQTSAQSSSTCTRNKRRASGHRKRSI